MTCTDGKVSYLQSESNDSSQYLTHYLICNSNALFSNQQNFYTFTNGYIYNWFKRTIGNQFPMDTNQESATHENEFEFHEFKNDFPNNKYGNLEWKECNNIYVKMLI